MSAAAGHEGFQTLIARSGSTVGSTVTPSALEALARLIALSSSMTIAGTSDSSRAASHCEPVSVSVVRTRCRNGPSIDRQRGRHAQNHECLQNRWKQTGVWIAPDGEAR